MAVFADFLVANPEEAEAALLGGIGMIEEGELKNFGKPGFDEMRAFQKGWGLAGEFLDAPAGGAEEGFGDPIVLGVVLKIEFDFLRAGADF